MEHHEYGIEGMTHDDLRASVHETIIRSMPDRKTAAVVAAACGLGYLIKKGRK